MRTCPVCGRQYSDDVTVCPDDNEPLGAVTIAGPKPTGDVDEDTVVRPKRATPLPANGLSAPRFTEVRLGPQEPSAAATTGPRPGGTGDVVYRERTVWPALAAAGIVVALGIAAAVYWVTAGQTDLDKEVGTQITDARIAVADARARLESLPADSPVRARLLALQQWDRELQNLELGHDRTREVASRAREIAAQARAVGEEARVAGATVPAAPPVVQPAAPATAAPLGGEGTVDPMATTPPAEPAEPPAGTPDEATPPATGTPPIVPPPGPTVKPAPGEGTNEPAPAGKTPEPGAPPPAKVPAPPPPPPPDENKKPSTP